MNFCFVGNKDIINTMKLILIKHGETVEGRKDIILGQMGGNLSAKGKIESRKIANFIKKEKLNPVSIVSSDLKRAKETAKIISKILNLPIKYNKLTRERSAGITQGKKEKYIDWKTYEKKSLKYRKHLGGESFLDVKQRAKKFLNQIKNKKETIIVVSHNVFLLMLISEFYKLPIEKSLKLPLENRIYIIDTKKRQFENCLLSCKLL